MLEDSTNGLTRLSRRDMLAGAAVAALVAATPLSLASPRPQRRLSLPLVEPARRYMAAAASMGNGWVMLTGGYDRPWLKGTAPAALNSALVVDVASGRWYAAAPMPVPRARHASVGLPDGRVLVLGGMNLNPTASVEIYDPNTDSWSPGTPLAQPRYDHTAIADGGSICVMGGSSQSIITGLEIVRLDGASWAEPEP